MLGGQISLESHRQPTGRTKDLGRGFVSIGLSRGGLLFSWDMRLRAQAALQGSQLAADGSAQEAEIADLHKSLREHMLQETLEKLLDGKGTLFELTGIGSTILKGNLRAFQGTAVVKSQQTAIADGRPPDGYKEPDT